MMIRWMCGTKLKDRIPSIELRARLGLEDISIIAQRRRLRWYGHVERRGDDWIKKCMSLEMEESRPQGRPKKKWLEVINADLKVLGLKKEDAMDRDAWRRSISTKERRVRCRPTQ